MPIAGASSSGGSAFVGGGSAAGGSSFVSGGRFGETGGSTTTAGSANSGTAGSVSSGNPGMVVANVSAVPVGSLTVAAGLYFLGRDAQGIYAMSMQCTHKGCVVLLAGEALQCTCHESRFDSNGEVLVGPAEAPLPHYAVHVDAAGNISVDRFSVVSGSARTAV